MSEQRKPAEAFHPSVFLQEEIAARGWSVKTVGEKSGLGRPNIEALMAKKRGINLLMAHGLAIAFDTSRDVWLNLQKQWDDFNRPPGPKNPPRHPTDKERG